MESMSNSLNWSQEVRRTGIDSKRYFSWVEKQYQLLAHMKSKDCQDITLRRFSSCLRDADWRAANDGCAIVNAYLLNAGFSSMPSVFLGKVGTSFLAVRVNGRCGKLPEVDMSTAEAYGFTAINLNILLLVRYAASDESKNSFLCVPLGKIALPPLWNDA